MNKFFATILIAIFQWIGKILFSDRIDLYYRGEFKGVFFASDENLIARIRQFTREL